ncbi:hypothetical protein OG393_03615 [Streptomyces sp. NBC_01216]|nr:hypothetical protein OG393_03615 [Streptomyces sp. NBC_01216]
MSEKKIAQRAWSSVWNSKVISSYAMMERSRRVGRLGCAPR